MKKIIFTTISVIFFALFASGAVFARGMMGNNMMGGNNAITQSNDGHTAREEAEGKEIWEKLQAEELKCENLTDDNFGALIPVWRPKALSTGQWSIRRKSTPREKITSMALRASSVILKENSLPRVG